MLNVYFATVGSADDIVAVYPPQRNADILAIGNIDSRLHSFSVWQLLKTAIAHTFGTDITDYNFAKQSNGKWVCDDFFFSLSHSHGVVAVAISDHSVGVDVEVYDHFVAKYPPDRFGKMLAKVLVPGDAADVKSALDFLSIWTKKESIFKCLDMDAFVPLSIGVHSAPTMSAMVNIDPSVFVSICGTDVCGAQLFYCNGGTIARAQYEQI